MKAKPGTEQREQSMMWRDGECAVDTSGSVREEAVRPGWGGVGAYLEAQGHLAALPGS